MRNTTLRRLVTGPAVAGLLLAPAVLPAGGANAAPADAGAAASAVPAPGRSDDARTRGAVMRTLQRMTLEEKVGQLLVTYAYGDRADTADPAAVAANRRIHGVDNAEQLVEKYHVGGIVYFAWSGNVKDPRQIAGLSNGLQRAAAGQRVPVPLTVATDQEYGVVYRVGPPATQFPGAMALGAGRSTADARRAAAVGGAELRALGVNQDYAPVADVNVDPANPVIGVRSFGEDPGLVATMVAAQVDGYQDSGVSATAKHFPGHGDTSVDSHTGLPVIDHTREEWERIDAPPFRAAVRAGADSIMTAHIVVPHLDPSGDPATLSEPVLTGLLREELGYDGVIVTDSLEMAGVRQKYGDDRVPVLALKAGADQLLMPPDTAVARDAVLEAVRSGELTERRIDESVYRVLRMKYRNGLFGERYVDPDAIGSVVGTGEHLATAQRIADRTTTLLRNDDGLLPLAPGRRSVLVTGWGAATTSHLASALERRGADTEVAETGTSPTQARIDAVADEAAGHDLVVVATNKAAGSAAQQRLVAALEASGTPVAVLAVRDPYDVAHLPDSGTYLATYSYAQVSLESAVKVLFGEVQPHGKLPVTVPKADPAQGALYPYGFGLGLPG
ncbi:glycoside hydrolase family 3 protein [Streptomyces sp. HB2AG]|uniref:glycoside hydrolase family 3 protein n=1 Tax=Streptomyces sp. HB2AG TaxID=2983400 RepID=UPI0022AA7099|nr:glycoside hydrolase family 3 protein [Streptomyces sp. HB2AG]MCZ2524809.1 glycoside hydrolase family 3 protein [Streptomyces sp. HB2AG]